MDTHLIGDVHLGKAFQHGVPLHRRGDRERMQLEHFKRELAVECDLSIQMGDLFDKMHVSYSVIYAAYLAYKEAKMRNPGRIYALLRGNHDASRDADKISAFQVFTQMVRPLGVVVVDDHAVEIGDHCLIPWHPFKTAVEMLPEDLTGLTCYGHWDVVMGDTNQIPAAEMKARGAVAAYTGHDHNAREMEIDGLPVTVTGSMQPYSHSEDPNGEFYVTITLEEAAAGDFRDKCVRVLLQPGEILDFPIDCLQLSIKRGAVEEEVDLGDVEFEEFDFNALFNQAREQVGVSDEMATTTRIKIEEARARVG